MKHLIRRAIDAHKDHVVRKFLNGTPEPLAGAANEDEPQIPGAVLYFPNADGTPGGRWIAQP